MEIYEIKDKHLNYKGDLYKKVAEFTFENSQYVEVINRELKRILILEKIKDNVFIDVEDKETLKRIIDTKFIKSTDYIE